jgi:far upstream element-binding protein
LVKWGVCFIFVDVYIFVATIEIEFLNFSFFFFLHRLSIVTIKQIQEQSGASVHVPKSANVDNPTLRTLQVTCPNLDGANLAKKLIEEVLSKKLSNNTGSFGNHYQTQQVSLQVSVPDKDVGLCIGRGGCVIKYMQSTTQTKIQIPPTVQNPGDVYRIITVTGPTMDACQQVQAMIHRILSEQSSAGVMSGNQQYHQQQQQQQYNNNGPQVNQPGYSAEWAAYHAAQQQQQQQQQYYGTQAMATPVVDTTTVTAGSAQQPQQQQVVANTATVAAATTNEYTEPFFRYAYYYGEDAARQYYGAWSPPIGTPNPYGINPNGITQPATVATTTAAAATSAGNQQIYSGDASANATSAVSTSNTPMIAATDNNNTSTGSNVTATSTTGNVNADDADTAAARETSRRHVSNLPAWMTKKA